jgi:erythronate-4-phosphate dehydrogenase
LESAQILFDKNITGIECRIKELASARSFDGRTIDASDLEDCEVLIVRSVTKVDRNLLDDSRVKLVCSATAGLDHVDVNYLAKSGIDFFSTQGCNSKGNFSFCTYSGYCRVRKCWETISNDSWSPGNKDPDK